MRIAVVPLILLGMSSALVPDSATAQGIAGIRSAFDLAPAGPVAPAPGLLTAASTAVRQSQAVDDPVGNGIAIGAAIGAGAALTMTAIMFAKCDEGCEAPAEGPTYAVAAGMGAGAGALVGWLIDKLHKSPSQRVYAAPVVSAKRRGITVAVRF